MSYKNLHRAAALILTAALTISAAGCGNISSRNENASGSGFAMGGAGGQMQPKEDDAPPETTAAEESSQPEATTAEETLQPETTAAEESSQSETTAAGESSGGDKGPEDTIAIPAGEVSLTDASGDFQYTGGAKWIGDCNHGYLQVPESYCRYQDVDVEGLVQYCADQLNIITLNHYDNVDAETAAANIYASMETEEGVEGLTAAMTQVAGYDARQIYGYYQETGQILLIWLIPDPDNAQGSYYISMEFTEGNQDMVACSSTFTPYYPISVGG